jgi:transcriptional regulator with XRE-family HTH domain
MPVTKLQAERLKRGLSQTALAATAGRMGASDISRFERGYGRPYPAQAERLARVLELTPTELLERASGPQHAA